LITRSLMIVGGRMPVHRGLCCQRDGECIEEEAGVQTLRCRKCERAIYSCHCAAL
jgi:hypothetical protein